MTLMRSTVRWSYRVFWYSLVTGIILLAIGISLMRIFLPDVKAYREQIEQLATAFLEQEVRIESMDARLAGLTPLIIFKDVHLLDAAGAREIARFDEARLGLDLWRSISSRKLIPKSFTVYGVNLGVILQEDGTLILRGLDLSRFEQQLAVSAESVPQGTGELARWLFERSELSLRNSTVVWQNARHGNKRIRFDNVNIDLRNAGERHQLTGRVSLPENLGRDFEVALDFRGNFLNPRGWQGGFHAQGRGIQLQNWGLKPVLFRTSIEEGLLDVSLWGEWQAGRLTSLTTDVDALALAFVTPGRDEPFTIRRLEGLFDWRLHAHGWVLNADSVQYQAQEDLWPKTRLRFEYASQDDLPRFDLYSSYARLQDISVLAQRSGLFDDRLRVQLAELNPQGDVDELHLSYARTDTRSPQFRISAQLNAINFAAWHKFPGVTSLDGTLLADERAGSLLLNDTDLKVAFPELFREVFMLTELKGRLDWWRVQGGWQLRSTHLDLATADISAELALQASIPENGASPWLDLQGRFRNGDATATWRYLPVSIMSSDLVNWLDTSLTSGEVIEGMVLFHGRLQNFPFRKQEGTFITDFQVRDVRLDYHKDWPAITVRNGQARFTGAGMQIVSQDSGLFATRLHDIRITIDDFRLPVLRIKSDIDGQLDDVVRFLVESPIAPQVRAFHAASKLAGSANGGLELLIPLSKDAANEVPLDYRGALHIGNASLFAWDKRLAVHDIRGQLEFSRKGIFSRELHGLFTGQPVRFDLHTREVAPRQIIELGMRGTLDAAQLPVNLPVRGLDRYISGRTPWQGLLRFGDVTPEDNMLGSLHINSSLEGLSIDLPAPAGKIGPAVSTLNLAMQFGEDGTYPLKLQYGNVLHSALLLATTDESRMTISKGVVNFSRQPAQLPAQEELRILGSITQLPVDAWRDIIRNLDIEADVPGMHSLGIPLVLDLDYLHLITQVDDAPGKAADPRKVSPINGEIRQFRFNDMQLGHVVIKTSRTADGLRIDKLSLVTPAMEVSGEGSWFWRDAKQRTNLLLMVSSDDVGTMVSSLGYQGVIRGGNLRGVVQASWDDAPNRFSYEILNGSLGVVVSDGALSDVNPGAGRLFGLLSLSELPRRLILDFSELREGFNFKQIIGQIDIVDGDAYTENLRIISPMAFISVEGRTGLASKDFDQDVTVVPNVSNTLPVISWLAWGGQIGALALLLDQIFGEQMNESIAAHYRISGSWEQPVIEKLAVPATGDGRAQRTE